MLQTAMGAGSRASGASVHAERRPVCQRCAQIKQACDGNLPCSRCTRLSLPCRPRFSTSTDGTVYPTPASAVDPHADSNHPFDVPKARIRRVQTGCLMCKARKKKCDETKPKCGDCRRLCLECQWPPPERTREKAAVKAAIRQHVKDAQRSQQQAPSSSSETSPTAAPEHGPATPSPPMTMSTTPATSTSSSAPATATPGMQTPPLHTKPPFGSITIRQRTPMSNSPDSIKREPSVDEDEDVGAAINVVDQPMTYDGMATWNSAPVSLKMEGDQGDEKTVTLMGSSPPHYDHMATSWVSKGATPSPWYEAGSMGGFESGSPDSTDLNTLTTYVPSLLPQLTSAHDRALLNHYSTIVSPLLSRCSNATANPYLYYLLPMAQSNDLVLHCILGLSGNHWRKIQPSMGNRGFIHQSQATQALARLLPQIDKSSADIALVSSLLLCMTELFDGTSEGWKLHLKGAKRLLAALKRHHGDLSSGQYKFLLRLSRFLDSAATVSTCRPPLMEDEARDAAAIEGMTRNADVEDSAVYGIPKELFHLVDAINSLAEKRKNRVDAASEAVFREEAAQVEERINHWSYEYGGLNRAVLTLAPADEDALHATLAFEHALRLRLHQIVEGYELTDPIVARSVEGILGAVQRIRYGSPLEPCLLFPLVMAGGACYHLEQRAVIQDRLMVMERTCGFGYVYNARDLVERVWLRRDERRWTEGSCVNWARIRYEEMHGLVVF